MTNTKGGDGVKTWFAKKIYLAFRNHIEFVSYRSPISFTFNCDVRVFGIKVAHLELLETEIVERFI